MKPKRKRSAPVKNAQPRKRRVPVAELRERIRELQGKLDHLQGKQTADTNIYEWRDLYDKQLRNYRLFVTDAARKLHLPPSFLVQGIEDGSLKTWKHALNVHEESLHRAHRNCTNVDI